MRIRDLLLTIFAGGLSLAAFGVAAQERLTMKQLEGADYMKDKRSFQSRCSACHTLADDSGHIAGPKRWGVFDRVAGSQEAFTYSDVLDAADF